MPETSMTTRDAILAAAADCFAADGYDGVSVAAICRRAGVSNGSFFHAFETKDGLAAELFLRALERYHDALLDTLSDGPDGAAGIARLVSAHLEWVTRCRPEAMLLFEHSRSEWMQHLVDRRADENKRFQGLFSAWIESRIAHGDLVDLPQPVFFAQLIGPAQIFCRAWLAGRHADSPVRYGASLTECAHRALLTPAGR